TPFICQQTSHVLHMNKRSCARRAACIESADAMTGWVKKASRTLREARMVTWGFLHKDHPVLAQIIPMRRCNLACAYCNEYDDVSKPVPLATMIQRLDRLAALGTTV